MHVLVTGGTGFLGRHLVRVLERDGMSVVIVNTKTCDLTRQENLLSLKDEKFDRIYHLAAWTKAGDYCLYHKGEQWIVNQQLNTNVLWFWKEFQPQAELVAMGTSCAYSPGFPLKEESYMKGDPDPDLYTYTMTKRMLYEGLVALRHQYGLNYRYLVPSTLYGPEFDPSDTHFVFDLIRKIVAGKENGDPVVLWGDGSQIRELIYVEDAVRLIELTAGKISNDILNVASGAGYSIKEYAQKICEIVGYDPDDIQYDTSRYVGVLKKILDTSRIDSLFNFDYTPLETGLRATIDSYLSDRLKRLS
ncbi:MAG: GDP-fucose synthetase [Rhodospirillaceae bacterium]|nr:MAG: GDP-fucose synthetase [Rhodospirillaceae bacterium]